MIHFVIADINPEKANKFKSFLKEMNEITVLVTVANGPHVTRKALNKNKETGVASLSLKAGDFEVKFNGRFENGQVVNGNFDLYEGTKKLVEISYSIKDGKAIALRAKLNCEGEYMVAEEIKRAFKRDFSHESHVMMDTPLEELRKPKLQENSKAVTEGTQVLVDNDNNNREELVEGADDVGAEFYEIEEETDEITEDLGELSEKLKEAIVDTPNMIALLNNLSHDITRGATVSFGERKADTKILENGASVEMFDDETGDYHITFRKGTLEEMIEVSFFLEKEDELIFSVYLSSDGTGKIATTSSQSDVIFRRVKYHLS